MIIEQCFWLANGNLKTYKTFHNPACLFWNINRRPWTKISVLGRREKQFWRKAGVSLYPFLTATMNG